MLRKADLQLKSQLLCV